MLFGAVARYSVAPPSWYASSLVIERPPISLQVQPGTSPKYAVSARPGARGTMVLRQSLWPVSDKQSRVP
jgi:hypothetical protein